MMKYDLESSTTTPDLMGRRNINQQILRKLRNLVDHIPYSDQEVPINDQYILELLAVLVKIFNSGLDMLQIQSPQLSEVHSGFFNHLYPVIENRKSTKFIQKCLKFIKVDRLKAPIWILLELNSNTLLEFILSNDTKEKYQNNACIKSGDLVDILDSYYSKHITLIGDKIYDLPTPLYREQTQTKTFFPQPPNISNNMQGDLFERFQQFEDIQPIKHVFSLDCDDSTTHAPTHRKQDMETPDLNFGSPLMEQDSIKGDESDQELHKALPQYISFQCKKSTKLLRELRDKQVEEYWNCQQTPINKFNGQCHACSTQIQKSQYFFFKGTAQFCHYSGLYFCNQCISPQLSVIPHLILNQFDFTQQQVSKEAYDTIKKNMEKIIFQINYFDNVVYKNQILYDFLIKKRSLRLMYDLLCQDFNFDFNFTQNYSHLILPINLFSLKNFIEINNKTLFKIVNEAYDYGIDHISKCPQCQKLSVKCAECLKGNIYIFDIVGTQYCRKCKKIFHRSCFYDKCTKCGQNQYINRNKLQR
ncbi:unnamed protein product [Paramecium sonneborni]|uniref:Rubicon Homology domain-containing protein n=1 Tax=Paramecium sonneborni TaxID=65129 RepID=A0A8S1QYK1_9CILI|nr:unnamed protein product [Paramecium sonneborni]